MIVVVGWGEILRGHSGNAWPHYSCTSLSGHAIIPSRAIHRVEGDALSGRRSARRPSGRSDRRAIVVRTRHCCPRVEGTDRLGGGGAVQVSGHQWTWSMRHSIHIPSIRVLHGRAAAPSREGNQRAYLPDKYSSVRKGQAARSGHTAMTVSGGTHFRVQCCGESSGFFITIDEPDDDRGGHARGRHSHYRHNLVCDCN